MTEKKRQAEITRIAQLLVAHSTYDRCRVGYEKHKEIRHKLCLERNELEDRIEEEDIQTAAYQTAMLTAKKVDDGMDNLPTGYENE